MKFGLAKQGIYVEGAPWKVHTILQSHLAFSKEVPQRALVKISMVNDIDKPVVVHDAT